MVESIYPMKKSLLVRLLMIVVSQCRQQAMPQSLYGYGSCVRDKQPLCSLCMRSPNLDQATARCFCTKEGKETGCIRPKMKQAL